MQTHSPSPESKRAVDDGYLWPFARQDMRDAQPIRERMVADIDHLMCDASGAAVVVAADLLRKGWTQTQIEQHGASAFRVFNARRRASEATADAKRGRSRRDIGARMLVDAAALFLFIGPVLFWAARATGTL